MKAGLVLAAGSVLLATSHGAVHKLKLQKIPITEKLQHADIATHARALYNKYSGQKLMGVPTGAKQEGLYQDTSIRPEKGGHPVDVENFMNAQCE